PCPRGGGACQPALPLAAWSSPPLPSSALALLPWPSPPLPSSALALPAWPNGCGDCSAGPEGVDGCPPVLPSAACPVLPWPSAGWPLPLCPGGCGDCAAAPVLFGPSSGVCCAGPGGADGCWAVLPSAPWESPPEPAAG